MRLLLPQLRERPNPEDRGLEVVPDGPRRDRLRPAHDGVVGGEDEHVEVPQGAVVAHARQEQSGGDDAARLGLDRDGVEERQDTDATEDLVRNPGTGHRVDESADDIEAVGG